MEENICCAKNSLFAFFISKFVIFGLRLIYSLPKITGFMGADLVQMKWKSKAQICLTVSMTKTESHTSNKLSFYKCSFEWDLFYEFNSLWIYRFKFSFLIKAELDARLKET